MTDVSATTEIKLKIRKIVERDLAYFLIWRNDPRVRRWLRQSTDLTCIEQVKWFEELQKGYPLDRALCALETIEEKPQLVGCCGLTSLSLQNRHGELSLFINPDLHGRGYGYAAARLLLDEAFGHFRLHSVWSESYYGSPAIGLAKKLEMEFVGAIPDHYFKDGGFTDAVIFSMTRGQWTKD